MYKTQPTHRWHGSAWLSGFHLRHLESGLGLLSDLDIRSTASVRKVFDVSTFVSMLNFKISVNFLDVELYQSFTNPQDVEPDKPSI